MSFPAYLSPIPHVTGAQMRDIDIHATKDSLSLDILLEHEGRALARIAQHDMCESCGKDILVFVGAGHNAGGGLVAARLLAQWGYPVTIVLAYDHTRMKVCLLYTSDAADD